jgi:hypothetical protein
LEKGGKRAPKNLAFLEKGKGFGEREKLLFPFPEITSPFKEQSVFQKGIFPAEPFGDSFGKKQLKGRSLFHPAEHDC